VWVPNCSPVRLTETPSIVPPWNSKTLRCSELRVPDVEVDDAAELLCHADSPGFCSSDVFLYPWRDSDYGKQTKSLKLLMSESSLMVE